MLRKFLLLAATSPLALFGLINNTIPYHLPFLLTRKIKDRNFHTSVRFVSYLILFPVWYIILYFLVGIFIGPWWGRLLYLLGALVTGIFSNRYFDLVKRVVSMWRLVVNKKKPKFLKLRILRDKIVSFFKGL